MSNLLARLRARMAPQNIVHRSLLLAFGYSFFWFLIHHTLTDAKLEPLWFIPQILSSMLIFFSLNGLFITFNYYRAHRIFNILVSNLYIQPFFNLFYLLISFICFVSLFIYIYFYLYLFISDFTLATKSILPSS